MYCAEIKIVCKTTAALGHMKLAEGFKFLAFKKRTVEQTLFKFRVGS